MSHIQPDTTLPKDPRIKVYTALLTQTSTDAPTAIVLLNTTGLSITWTRNTTGIYWGNLSGGVTLANTAVIIQQTFGGNNMTARAANANTIEVTTKLMDNTALDGVLNKTTIEIRIYE